MFIDQCYNKLFASGFYTEFWNNTSNISVYNSSSMFIPEAIFTGRVEKVRSTAITLRGTEKYPKI